MFKSNMVRDETSDAVSRTRNFGDASALRSSTALVISTGLLDRVSSPPPCEIDLGSSTARAWANAGSNSQQAGLTDGAVSAVEGLAALGVFVVLGRLATVVFPVVAYDPHSPDPFLVIRRRSILV